MNESFELPKNLEAEQALLGSLLLHNGLLHKLAFLRAEDFYEPVHGRVFAAISSMASDGEVADPVTLKRQFDADGSLEDIGGAKYIGKLAACAGMSINAEAYAREIQRTAALRALVDLSQRMMSEIMQSDTCRQPEEIAADMLAVAESVTGEETRRKTRTHRQVAEAIAETMAKALPASSTGLPKLDEAMDGGLYKGKAYGIAAKQKVGKTAMLATLSYNLGQGGIPHLFVCGEMGAEEVHQRQIARALDCYPSDFRNERRHSPAFQRQVIDAGRKIERGVIYRDAPGLTFDELRRYVASAVSVHGIEGFILDYWQLVGGQRKGQNEREHLDAVAQWIAEAVKKYNIWAIVAAQVNKEGTTRGGQGMRLSFDQVYQINREDTSSPFAWLEMMDTRYTRWANVGSQERPGLELIAKGPYFREYS